MYKKKSKNNNQLGWLNLVQKLIVVRVHSLKDVHTNFLKHDFSRMSEN